MSTFAAATPLLQVDNLSTAFRTSRGILRAVDNVSFTLAKGETLGIVGESGSGKSVLVRSIMNILPRTAIIPPQSKVILNGKDTRKLTKAEAKHFWGTQIAMVFQDPMTSLNPVKKIGTQIGDPLRYHLGLSRDAARSSARWGRSSVTQSQQNASSLRTTDLPSLILALEAAHGYVSSTPLPGLPADGEEPAESNPLEDGETAT